MIPLILFPFSFSSCGGEAEKKMCLVAEGIEWVPEILYESTAEQ
jgi:hypothetical protein